MIRRDDVLKDDEEYEAPKDEDDDEDEEDTGIEPESDIPSENINPTSSPNGEDPDGV